MEGRLENPANAQWPPARSIAEQEGQSVGHIENPHGSQGLLAWEPLFETASGADYSWTGEDFELYNLTGAQTNQAIELNKFTDLGISHLNISPSTIPLPTEDLNGETECNPTKNVAPDTYRQQTEIQSPRLSEQSWDEADHLGTLYDDVRVELDKLLHDEHGCILTGPMVRGDRRIVHYLAHCRKLNHVSLGSGRARRMLISRRSIVRVDDHCKPHNFHEEYPKIVPSGLTFTRIPAGVHEQHLWDEITNRGLSKPISMFYDAPSKKNSGRAWARFARATDAANCREALNGYQWPAQTSAPMMVGFELLHEPSDGTATISTSVMTAVPSSPALSRMNSGLSSSRTLSSQRMTSMSSSSLFSTSSRGQSSTLLSADSDYASGASASKKRRRNPRVEAGYPCKGCSRAFDRESDRKKHEISHLPPELLQHRCEACDKGFQSAKDLRRHKKAIHRPANG